MLSLVQITCCVVMGSMHLGEWLSRRVVARHLQIELGVGFVAFCATSNLTLSASHGRR